MADAAVGALPGGRGRQSVLSRITLLPVAVWAVVLVAAPNLLLLAYSLFRTENGRMVPALTLENYVTIATSEVSRTLLLRTLLTGFGAALLATCIAYPMAYFVVRRLGKRRLLALMLVIVPLWVSYLVRVYAWKIILGDSGVINATLEMLGLIDGPLTFLLYSRIAVFLVLTYVSVPFVFVSSYAALERIPSPLFEAGSDCGASPFHVLRTIVWPLSRGGAAIGFALAVLMCMGDYLTPTLVGGLQGTMFGNLIVSEFGLANNWPRGAALSIALLVVVGMLLAVIGRLTRTEAVLE